MIALLDYGAGNLTSVRKGLAASGADVFTPSTPADLARALRAACSKDKRLRATLPSTKGLL